MNNIIDITIIIHNYYICIMGSVTKKSTNYTY